MINNFDNRKQGKTFLGRREIKLLAGKKRSKTELATI